MTTPDLPSEVPAEDWADQHTEARPDAEAVLEAGEIVEPLETIEANEADVVEQETEVPPLDDEP